MIKVLVVSESAILRAGIRAILGRARDIRIVGETSTTDGVARLVEARAVDVLLLDPSRAAGQGLDLLQQIRATAVRVPAMLVTRDASPLDLSRALMLGCTGYVDARVAPRELMEAVRRVARGERVVEPALADQLLSELVRQPAADHSLTAAERDVLRLLAEGQTNREIARRLNYSVGTVKDYVQNVLKKLEVSDRTQAAVKALRLGILE